MKYDSSDPDGDDLELEPVPDEWTPSWLSISLYGCAIWLLIIVIGAIIYN